MKIEKIIVLCICILFLCSCGKKEMEFYCEEGVLKGSRCLITEEKNAEYTCEEGFNFNEESKKCENIISVQASYDIVCDGGYYLENGKCISEEDLPYNNGMCSGSIYQGKCKDIRYRYKAYHCLYGTLNNETNKCDLVDERNPIETKCDDEYEYNKKKKVCERSHYTEALEREVES